MPLSSAWQVYARSSEVVAVAAFWTLQNQLLILLRTAGSEHGQSLLYRVLWVGMYPVLERALYKTEVSERYIMALRKYFFLHSPLNFMRSQKTRFSVFILKIGILWFQETNIYIEFLQTAILISPCLTFWKSELIQFCSTTFSKYRPPPRACASDGLVPRPHALQTAEVRGH
jgi:hypothetical protein